jgi:hypothetical protein
MQESSAKELGPMQSNMQESRPDPANIYSEQSVWLCENRNTRYKTRIHGALAQILQKYPNDYKLRLLSTKEPPNEHSATAGE